MADSRNKGASFEREVAKLLFLELGISFKRDLRQYQTSGHGDLIPSDPGFPFELELKRYAKGPISGPDKWWQQVCVAAGARTSDPRFSTNTTASPSAAWSSCRAFAATSHSKISATSHGR
jgi:hypothetical protein